MIKRIGMQCTWTLNAPYFANGKRLGSSLKCSMMHLTHTSHERVEVWFRNFRKTKEMFVFAIHFTCGWPYKQKVFISELSGGHNYIFNINDDMLCLSGHFINSLFQHNIAYWVFLKLFFYSFMLFTESLQALLGLNNLSNAGRFSNIGLCRFITHMFRRLRFWKAKWLLTV